METAIGDMLVVADEQDRLRALGWADLEARLRPDSSPRCTATFSCALGPFRQ